MTSSASGRSEAAVILRDVEMRFGPTRALRDISLSVPRGSLYGLLGPNGAGKTTTLRIIATDLPASEGQVEVLGFRLPSGAGTVRCRLGYMPDSAGLYPELDLREYLEFFAALYGLKGASQRTAASTAMELAGTSYLAERRLEGLSRGEQQRVLLARTLIHEPELLVLDEPAAGLDPRGRVELRELLRLLHERGTTVLISSHILSDLEEICTHLALIDRGRVVFQGSRERLLASGLQRCRIRVESLDGMGRLLERLAMRSELVVEEPEGNAVEVDAPPDPAFSRDLLRELVVADLPITSFSRRTESLEDIYLRLTEPEEESP
jgi:ABC-2 type transport system ATP-binding protein